MYKNIYRILVIMIIINSESTAQTDVVDTLISINPKATYLKLNNDSGALNAIAINFYDLGLNDLEYIILQQKGDYNNGPGGDIFTGMTGVFSFTDSLLETALQHRVPGAIETGEDFYTHNTWYGNLATDIPEDFYIDSIVIQIPDSGNYLFISPHDSWFNDNTDPDGDYGVRIAKTEIKSLEAFSAHSSPKFELIQNYPNPFNPSTTIKYSIPKSSNIELSIYNLAGQKLTTLVNKSHHPGNHQITWDGSKYASGVYIYQIKADNFVQSKKMLLLK